MPTAFLITPFSPARAGDEDADSFHAVQRAVEQATAIAGLELKHPARAAAAGVIMDQVTAAIKESDIVVAILTGENPNVFLEVGQALESAKRPVVFLRDTAEGVPFDIRHHRIVTYGGQGELASLASNLAQALRETLALPASREDRAETRSAFRLPHPRNPNFTGRDKALQRLESQLGELGTSAVTQAVTGMGGVGKTQLAVEYAHRHKAKYRIVWWLRCEDAATLASDYAELASELGLPQATPAPADADVELETPGTPPETRAGAAALAAVRRHLDASDDWLLIFDNAQTPADVRPYLPAGAGHVIITSRNPAFGGVATPLRLKTWSRKDAVAYIQGRAGRHETKAAKDLARVLGDLPLALAQAGAHIESQGLSVAEYLALYQVHHVRFLGAPGPADYPASVLTTFSIAIDGLRDAPASRDLLHLCAFLAPEDIPLDLLARHHAAVGGRLQAILCDDLERSNAAGRLHRAALAERSGEVLSVHRVVQQVVRDTLPEGEGATWVVAAVAFLEQAFPYDPDRPATWRDCARVLPHALAAADHAETYGMNAPKLPGLLNNLALFLRMQGDFPAARDLAVRSVMVHRAVFGPNHTRTASALNNLGLVLRDLGRLQEAKSRYEDALRIDEAAFGPDHHAVGLVVNNLGNVLQDLDDLQGARAHFERALQIARGAHGRDHPSVAAALRNLGGVLRVLEELTEARTHLEEALRIHETVHGADHPEVATDLNNLGLVLKRLDDLDGARAHYERALEIDEALHGDDHPTVAIRLNNLGGVLYSLEDYRGAKEMFERALEIGEATLGPGHVSVATRLNNLGKALQGLGDLQAARDSFVRAHRIFEAVLGPDATGTTTVRKNLNTVLGALGSAGA